MDVGSQWGSRRLRTAPGLKPFSAKAMMMGRRSPVSLRLGSGDSGGRRRLVARPGPQRGLYMRCGNPRWRSCRRARRRKYSPCGHEKASLESPRVVFVRVYSK